MPSCLRRPVIYLASVSNSNHVPKGNIARLKTIAFKTPAFKIAVIVGTNRRESINRRLAQALGKLRPDRLDFPFVRIDDLPIYNQDDEANLPASVVRFKAEIEAADGILFVTPEHSRSIPAVLKNAIDWGARPWGKNSWTGKVAAVTGTSPGAISTALAQQHLRQILGAQGVVLTAGETYLPSSPA